jgi:hypothetical protein
MQQQYTQQVREACMPNPELVLQCDTDTHNA